METPTKHNSLRNFPGDMFLIFGFPILSSMFLSSAIFEFVMNHPHGTAIASLSVAFAGACLVFWAKLPLYQERIFLSFGPRSIPESRKMFYYWGMGLAAFGCGVAALLLL